jgi:hypothetical protein
MKKLLLISLVVLALACNKKDDPAPSLATNTMNLCGTPDTTDYTPQLIDGYLTCYFDGVFFQSDASGYFVNKTNDTLNISANKNFPISNPSNPSEVLLLDLYNYVGVGSYCFNGLNTDTAKITHSTAPAGSSTYNGFASNFNNNGNAIIVTLDSGHKIQGYFYGKIKDSSTGDTIRVSSGRFSLNY